LAAEVLMIPVTTRHLAGLFILAAIVSPAGLIAQQQAPAGGGQGRGIPPAPRNLQILKPEEVQPAMRAFAAALQVQCSYCHVMEPTRDFASDDKQAKKTARVMLQMVAHVNETIAAGVAKPAADVTRVQCATCHRGKPIPETPELAPPSPPAPAGGGATPR
jgi:photosynthetic reaction center cytochrome c subunit